ncbi:hypothetical protein [Streptomyces jumonjinensis]|uniref:hypothetical protein n=1 Tax=Streptomyces jumonjinensis TaxID=1945 RepID=UPI0037A0CA66
MAYRKTSSKGITVSLAGHQDPEYHEVQAVARRLPLADYLELVGLSAEDEPGSAPHVVRQLERFADALISWNIEEENGAPTPASREEFFRLDETLALALATEWVERLGGKVDGPLPQSSPAGEPSPVASIPTETLSAPQPNTAVPA